MDKSERDSLVQRHLNTAREVLADQSEHLSEDQREATKQAVKIVMTNDPRGFPQGDDALVFHEVVSALLQEMRLPSQPMVETPEDEPVPADIADRFAGLAIRAREMNEAKARQPSEFLVGFEPEPEPKPRPKPKPILLPSRAKSSSVSTVSRTSESPDHDGDPTMGRSALPPNDRE